MWKIIKYIKSLIKIISYGFIYFNFDKKGCSKFRPYIWNFTRNNIYESIGYFKLYLFFKINIIYW